MNTYVKPADINLSIVVNGKPEKAFVLFTESMGSWWPKGQIAAPHRTRISSPNPA